MIVAMLGVYLCNGVRPHSPAILIGAIAGVVCALAFSGAGSRAVPSRQALPVLIP